MQHFAGVRGGSADNSSVMKGAFLGALAVLGLSFSAAAQQMSPSLDASYTFALFRPEIFNTVDGSTLIHRLPVRTFLDGTRFPVSSEMGRMGTAPVDLPSLAYTNSEEVEAITVSQTLRTDGKDYGSGGKDSSDDLVTTPLHPIHTGGEVGVFYGAWSGKYSGDAMGTYMQGNIGNDKFQINVGASYQEWNVKTPHGRR